MTPSSPTSEAPVPQPKQCFDTANITPPPELYHPSIQPSSTSCSGSSTPTNSRGKFFSKSNIDSSEDIDCEAALPPPSFKRLPYSASPEHFRDINFLPPFTFHRISVLFWISAAVSFQLYIQQLLLPSLSDDSTRSVPTTTVWVVLGFIWLVPFPAALIYILGSLWFSHNTKLDDVSPNEHNVCFRIVSRGINNECLLATIHRIQEEMKLSPMFPYIIEVVTDGDVFQAPDEDDVVGLQVPDNYATDKGSLFKARALHYACKYSCVPPTTWIVHLDEESQPTSSGIKGIAAMIDECETSGNVKRIGQGAILYHRGWKKHPFLTLADMRRTGDDMGHFFFQHRVGRTIFGLHGSFVVCRQDVESSIGFDLGPDGSITEDAWWVLLAMKEGIRTKWVDGYVEEQSTQSIGDFLKQRRRWYIGLFKTATLAPVNFRYKALLMWNTATWFLIPVFVPLTIASISLSYYDDRAVTLPIRILSSLVFAASMLVYMNGILANMREHGTPWWRVPLWIVLMIVLMPLFFVMEFLSVLYAVVSPLMKGTSGFHVVKKSDQ